MSDHALLDIICRAHARGATRHEVARFENLLQSVAARQVVLDLFRNYTLEHP